MTNGLDSLLDERTAKTLDRLQRYAASNQRAYFSALRELRVVQNNRHFRLAAEGQHEDAPLPELVSVAQLTKRTQSALLQRRTPAGASPASGGYRYA